LYYRQYLFLFLAGIITTALPVFAATASSSPQVQHTQTAQTENLLLKRATGFFRFSFDNVSMPENISDMGLLGVNYFVDFTPYLYGGVGGYGAVTGTQGGLFALGLEGGAHYEWAPHWWADAGFFAGGGGGKSSLVGGGLMIKPHVGIAYSFPWARVGLHYSYIDFVDGKISSHQIGLDVDIPTTFYYLSPQDAYIGCSLFNGDLQLLPGDYLEFQRNDFSLLLQAYDQRAGTKNTSGEIQNGTIKLVGAEFDHYFTERNFWWLKTAGAFNGIPNGYMDVLGGWGYLWPIGNTSFAIVPKLGVGAGGGGMVDTGGGFLINPQLGVQWSLFSNVAFRISSGYLWAPKGDFHVVPVTGELIYHLDIARGKTNPPSVSAAYSTIQGWRLQFFNQTYFHPQRTSSSVTSSINLLGVQIDQLFTPYFFFTYQAASAYSGYHAGGYASGMIGPGVQSAAFFNERLQLFSEILVGAGGGGGLALQDGAMIAPVIGLRYLFTPVIGLQVSMSQMTAVKDDLNTPALNIGLTIRLDTLNQTQHSYF